jgi:hypothetical protein
MLLKGSMIRIIKSKDDEMGRAGNMHLEDECLHNFDW